MRTLREKRLEFAAVILGIIVALTGFSYHFAQAKDKAVFTKKQLELRNLGDVILEYTLFENSAPQNPSRNKWCKIDDYYGKRHCLGELERDGYVNVLPISPDEYPYYYRYTRDALYVGTPVPDGFKPKGGNYCYGNNDELIWCYVIE